MENLNFLDIYSKNIQISKFPKLGTVGAELLLEVGQRQTDRHMTKLTADFLNFAKAFKKKLSGRMECCVAENCNILQEYENMCLAHSQAFRTSNTLYVLKAERA